VLAPLVVTARTRGTLSHLQAMADELVLQRGGQSAPRAAHWRAAFPNVRPSAGRPRPVLEQKAVMELLTWTLQAIGLFLATNIDDIIVLSLFYARGAGQRGTTAKILVGQYVGFGAILAAAVLVALGARTFLPEAAIPYFGLIPLGLGLLAAWRVWRSDDDDDEGKVSGKTLSALTIAAVTFANGGDNIGVYVPVFATVGTAGIAAYTVVFLALVAVLVAAARFVATRKGIAEVLERWEHVLFPFVLIGLGVVILVEGGAFGL